MLTNQMRFYSCIFDNYIELIARPVHVRTYACWDKCFKILLNSKKRSSSPLLALLSFKVYRILAILTKEQITSYFLVPIGATVTTKHFQIVYRVIL